MAESKFINPLFQRTEPARRGRLASVGEPGVPRELPVEPEPAALGHAPVKFTFYFLPSQLQRLDDLWVRAKLEHRERLNKSEFVRLAVDRLMEEFERDPKGVLAELRRNRG